MKIAEHIELKLLINFGFKKSKDYFEEDDLQYESEYFYDLGYSRRGQSYYLLVEEDKTINIYASDPSGTGGRLLLNNFLINLITNNIIVNS